MVINLNLIQQDDLALRRMHDTPQDYAYMATWLTDPHVLEFYEGRNNPYPLDRVLAKYRPRVRGESATVPCFLLYVGTPIGYLQYYPLSRTDTHAYGLPDTSHAYGMDLFIGEPAYWNQGLGAKFVTLATCYLSTQLHVTHLTLDPRVDNHRAIRCYERCGFRKIKLLPEHEYHEGRKHNNWLMVCERV